jgi:hypothetical protein
LRSNPGSERFLRSGESDEVANLRRVGNLRSIAEEFFPSGGNFSASSFWTFPSGHIQSGVYF